jgi:hypothetical protein
VMCVFFSWTSFLWAYFVVALEVGEFQSRTRNILKGAD